MQPASQKTASILRENWLRVSAEVAQACHAAGRVTDQVQVVGVTKYVAPEFAWQLAQAGCHVLAENRPQGLWEKADYCDQQSRAQPVDVHHSSSDVRSPSDAAPSDSAHSASLPQAAHALQWHLIGHLQRNKLKRTLPIISLLHSLDSLRLAQAISREAVAQQLRCRLLLEVNVTSDSSKTGMSIDDTRRVLELADELPGIEFCGLMAMSSLDATADRARREFQRVSELRDELQQEFPGLTLRELSMGMSGDFREAIAAGATLVRIGSSLWQGIL